LVTGHDDIGLQSFLPSRTSTILIDGTSLLKISLFAVTLIHTDDLQRGSG
jgi:hypothetical protein